MGWGILGVLMMETWYFDGGVDTKDTSSGFAFFFGLLHELLFGGYAGERKMGGNSQHGMEFSTIASLGLITIYCTPRK